MKMTCRVCGNTYEACKTPHTPGVSFRWQDVACSPECGEVYLHRILVSRGLAEDKPAEKVEEFAPVVGFGALEQSEPTELTGSDEPVESSPVIRLF
jgi:hypothetical protein